MACMHIMETSNSVSGPDYFGIHRNKNEVKSVIAGIVINVIFRDIVRDTPKTRGH